MPGPRTPSKASIRIGLMPGSRDKEILSLLPVMLAAAGIIRRRIPRVNFVVSQAPMIARSHIERIINEHGDPSLFPITDESVEAVYRQCHLAIAASGTVTLQAAIAGTPVVVVYKVSPLSYHLGKALIQVKNVALVNLIAGKDLVPELIQDKASPENIAETVCQMLEDRPGLERLGNELLKVKDLLGSPGASERVADIAMELLEKRKSNTEKV
jgi:lipid-A-disaccharide synthase